MNFVNECLNMTLEGMPMHNQFTDYDTGTCLICYVAGVGYRMGQDDASNGISQTPPAELVTQNWVFDAYYKG